MNEVETMGRVEMIIGGIDLKEFLKYNPKHEGMTMSSVDIAQIMGKEHRNVKRDIEKLSKVWERRALKVERSSYTSKQGKLLECFILSKTQTTSLLSKYSDDIALFIQTRWEQLEKEKESANIITLPNFTNPAEAAREWANQYEGRLIAEKKVEILTEENTILLEENEQLQEKAEIVDTFMNSHKFYTLKETADIIEEKEYGRNNFIKWLKGKGYMTKHGQPSRTSIESNWMVSRILPGNNYHTTLVTARGLDLFSRKLKDEIYENKHAPHRSSGFFEKEPIDRYRRGEGLTLAGWR